MAFSRIVKSLLWSYMKLSCIDGTFATYMYSWTTMLKLKESNKCYYSNLTSYPYD
jgi:hypothetical protein